MQSSTSATRAVADVLLAARPDASTARAVRASVCLIRRPRLILFSLMSHWHRVTASLQPFRPCKSALQGVQKSSVLRSALRVPTVSCYINPSFILACVLYSLRASQAAMNDGDFASAAEDLAALPGGEQLVPRVLQQRTVKEEQWRQQRRRSGPGKAVRYLVGQVMRHKRCACTVLSCFSPDFFSRVVRNWCLLRVFPHVPVRVLWWGYHEPNLSTAPTRLLMLQFGWFRHLPRGYTHVSVGLCRFDCCQAPTCERAGTATGG